MGMLERDIENKVCRYAREKGWVAYKFTSPNRRNVPDRLFINPYGYVAFIEFKAPGKKPTAGQLREIERLMGRNIDVFVVDNVEDGKRIVQQFQYQNA